MANATQATVSDPSLQVSADNGRLIGLLIVSVGPALFWTTLLGVSAWSLGYSIAPEVLIGNFLAIATFLGIVFATLAFSGDGKQEPKIH